MIKILGIFIFYGYNYANNTKTKKSEKWTWNMFILSKFNLSIFKQKLKMTIGKEKLPDCKIATTLHETANNLARSLD